MWVCARGLAFVSVRLGARARASAPTRAQRGAHKRSTLPFAHHTHDTSSCLVMHTLAGLCFCLHTPPTPSPPSTAHPVRPFERQLRESCGGPRCLSTCTSLPLGRTGRRQENLIFPSARPKHSVCRSRAFNFEARRHRTRHSTAERTMEEEEVEVQSLRSTPTPSSLLSSLSSARRSAPLRSRSRPLPRPHTPFRVPLPSQTSRRPPRPVTHTPSPLPT